jgi:hypothetical protein
MVPLHNILIGHEDTDYIHRNALQAIPKQKLVQFEWNFMRFDCLWNSFIPLETYVHKCIQHKMHMFEAKDLIKVIYANCIHRFHDRPHIHCKELKIKNTYFVIAGYCPTLQRIL